MQWWLTIASIRLAVICLATWFICRRWACPIQTAGARQPGLRFLTDLVWVIGSLASLTHMLAVFAYVHNWSHQLAVDDTARQTEEFMGVSVGVGVYFNYLFVALWLIDASWLLFARKSYDQRKVWINRLVYGYMIFIAFNGAVVFVSGWFRWFSAALFLVMAISWTMPLKPGSVQQSPKKSHRIED